jgi:hypothetical protein
VHLAESDVDKARKILAESDVDKARKILAESDVDKARKTNGRPVTLALTTRTPHHELYITRQNNRWNILK